VEDIKVVVCHFLKAFSVGFSSQNPVAIYYNSKFDKIWQQFIRIAVKMVF